jgi:hypothetical protein
MDRLIHAALPGKPAWSAEYASVVGRLQATRCATSSSRPTNGSGGSSCVGARDGNVVMDSPDAGRGRTYALVVVDECDWSQIWTAWQQTIRPR